VAAEMDRSGDRTGRAGQGGRAPADGHAAERLCQSTAARCAPPDPGSGG